MVKCRGGILGIRIRKDSLSTASRVEYSNVFLCAGRNYEIDKITTPSCVANILSSAWSEWQQQENNTTSYQPPHTYPKYSQVTRLPPHSNIPRAFESNHARKSFNKRNRKLYTFAEQTPIRGSELDQQFHGTEGGISLVDLFELSTWETPRLFVAIVAA